MRRLTHTDYPVVAQTHPGMKGKNNEDCFGVSAYSLEPLGPWPILLGVLCDGIGGHRAGEVAAEIAVERISNEVGKSNAANPVQILNEAIQAASDAIYARAKDSPYQSGMGSTCACAWIIGSRLYTATVGDSRVYLLRGGKIRRLSTDHTWVQEAVEKGVLTADQINGHPNQHVIRRYLGSPTPPEVDFRLKLQENEEDAQAEANQGMTLLPGDMVLLTSDGLTDLVNDVEIESAYSARFTLGQGVVENAGHNLIDLANQRGGHDNITLVAIFIPLKPVKAALGLRHWARRNWAWAAGGCLLLAAALVAALGLAGGWWWSSVASPERSTSTPAPMVQPATETDLPQNSPQPTMPSNPPSGFLTPTSTPSALLPVESGPTLTPWPTNTTAP